MEEVDAAGAEPEEKEEAADGDAERADAEEFKTTLADVVAETSDKGKEGTRGDARDAATGPTGVVDAETADDAV